MAEPKPQWTEEEWEEYVGRELDQINELVGKAPEKDMKFDKGKPQAHIPFEDFPRALFEVMQVCNFGANKYERSSWRDVPNRDQRYRDAYMRHFFQLWNGQRFDEETGLDHRAHIVWGLLASMQVDFEADKEKEGA